MVRERTGSPAEMCMFLFGDRHTEFDSFREWQFSGDRMAGLFKKI